MITPRTKQAQYAMAPMAEMLSFGDVDVDQDFFTRFQDTRALVDVARHFALKLVAETPPREGRAP